MYHPTTVENIVRGDTGVKRDGIVHSLTELGEGGTVTWQRFSDLPGARVLTVTRRGHQFEVAGHTRLGGQFAASS